jgi:hypothetical protein
VQQADSQQSAGLHVDGNFYVDAGWQQGGDVQNQRLRERLIRLGDVGGTHAQQNGH